MDEKFPLVLLAKKHALCGGPFEGRLKFYGVAACFNCVKIVDLERIFWVGSRIGWRVAFCKKCYVDSVIDDEGTGSIDLELLKAMKAYYFSTSKSPDHRELTDAEKAEVDAWYDGVHKRYHDECAAWKKLKKGLPWRERKALESQRRSERKKKPTV